MFCEKCGRPVEGEQTLCSSCAAEQPAQVPEVNEITAPSYETFALNTADSVPAKKAPKKKGGLIAVIAAVVAVAAIAVGVVLNMDGIRGFVGRTFQSPEDYLVSVESAAIADYSADLTQEYGKILSSYNENQTAAKGDIRLTLGDELLSLVESALQQQGLTMEVDWLRQIKISASTNIQETAMQMALGVGLGEENLLSADMILDIENGKGYVGIPELNDDYLYTSIASDISLNDFKEILSQSMAMRNGLIEALPTEEELNKLINTYTDVILSGIKKVDKENDTVTIDGVSQKMVVLTAKIKEADLLDMAEAVLKKAEKDKTIEKVLTALSDYTNEMNEFSGVYYAPVDLYQEFVDAIPYAIEELEEVKEQADSGNYLKLKVYVDMKNQIRGHELTVYTEGQQTSDPISWLTVVKGDVTYTEAELGGVEITGEKTQKKDVSEGHYALSVYGEKIGTLEFENVTENSSTLRLIPSEEIMSAALSGSGIPTALLGDNLALELSYSAQDTNKVSYEVNVLMGSKKLIGLATSSEAFDGGEISIPANALDANRQKDVTQWVKGLEFDDVLAALEKTDVPKELVDAARSYVELLLYYMN